MLSMPTPSWDPVIRTLGGILDPKVVISWLNMEWSQRQGLTLNKKTEMSYFRPVGNQQQNAKITTELVTPKPDVGKRGRVRRSISQVVERQMRCTHLQYHKDSHRHFNSLDLQIHWVTGCLVCRFSSNHAHQSKSRGLYHILCIHQRPRHQCFQKQQGKRVR